MALFDILRRVSQTKSQEIDEKLQKSQIFQSLIEKKIKI
jgi:hypothetical protein